jgi:hypothetical protein
MRPRLTPASLVLLVLATSALFAGCGDDDDTPMPDAGPGDATVPRDAGGDASGEDAGPVDLGTLRPCRVDADCADRVDCTVDSCDPRGFCRNPVDLTRCDDGIFCNGVEQCNLVRGCVPGPPEACNDDDVCTIDRCDEESKSCGHFPRDFDEDGEADWHCAGGTDCDDRDPTRGARSSELCEDGIDNDCDEVVDENEAPGDCGGPPYDTACDEPLDVSAGGVFTVSTVGAGSNFTLSCTGAGYRDVVLSFTLTEPKDVFLNAGGEALSAIALHPSRPPLPDDGSRCAIGERFLPLGTALDCNSGFPAQLRKRALPAGTYYLVVASAPWLPSGGDEVAVEVVFSPPSDPPSNETCAAPIDVSAGGRFRGSFVDVADDVFLSCGYGGSPDLVYAFTLTEAKDVAITATSSTGDSLSGAIFGACGVVGEERRCTGGAPFDTRLHSLPAGTYHLILEGPSYRDVEFDLDVSFFAPTPVPGGETCDNALPLALDTRTTGTLADKQDDLVTTCGFNYADAVYSFELTERRDLTVLIDGGTRYMNASIRPSCESGAGELRCDRGTPVRSRLRDVAPGTYFLVIEGFSRASFAVTVTTSAPTVAVPVSGNDTCGSATPIPLTGGLFTGSTATALDDYRATVCTTVADGPDAAFRLDLPTPKLVTASTDGSTFDTVLTVFRDSCVSGGDAYCDDDGGSGSGTSALSRMLGPGTFFFVVDGFGPGNLGDYTFEVIVADP